MAYINEFPHTRNYDQDLGQLICLYKKLSGEYETLVQIYEIVKKDINDITIEQLQKWLDDGTLDTVINQKIFNELNEKVDTNTNALKGVAYQDLSKRKFIFIGDSYNSSDHHGGWGQNVATIMGLASGSYLNIGQGGACFGNASNNYKTLFDNITATLTADQKIEYTDIVINGSINDWAYNNTEIASSFNYIQDKVRNEFPNAKFWVLNVGWSYENDTIRQGIIKCYNAYKDLNKYGAVVDCFSNFLDPAFLESDMAHPTATGMELLARSIVSILNGGKHYHKRYSDLNTHFNAITIYGEVLENGYHIYNNKYVGIRFDSSPITINNTTQTKLTETPLNPNNNLFMRTCTFPVMTLIETQQSGLAYVQGSGIVTVKRHSNENAYDLLYQNQTMYNNDFQITNVTGIYLLFDCFVDIDKN